MLKVVGASWTTSRICSLIIGTVGVFGFLLIITWELDRPEEDGKYAATIFWTESKGYHVEFWGEGNDLASIPEGVARAVFTPDIKNTGWALLEIESQSTYSDEIQAYGAGFLEGSLSWQLMYHHWMNTVLKACEGRQEYCQQVRIFLRNNTQAVREAAVERRHQDPFWHQVYLFYKQLDGLVAGWQFGMIRNQGEFRALSIPSEDFLWMNVASDLVDLEYMFNGSYEATGSPFAFSNAAKFSSAFVKLLGPTRQLFVAHNSGGLYRSMLKMMKRYNLKYHLSDAANSADVPGQTVTFSSYPGVVHSQDDFYQVTGKQEHQLAVTGTAIVNYNQALWDRVSPLDQVLIGPRAMAANRLAVSGRSWAHLIVRENSGTGNKQWLIVNPSRLDLAANKKGLLIVVEQLPGYTHVSDHSRVLWSEGYWANHGLPFHHDILNESGTVAMEHLFGSAFSWKKSPLSRMFHRDQANVTDATSVQHLMRSNDYLADPLSSGNPSLAISARGDLPAAQNTVLQKELVPAGATDCKVLSLSFLARQFKVQATAGPSSSDKLTSFKWSASNFNTQLHRGQPDLWNFEAINPYWAWED